MRKNRKRCRISIDSSSISEVASAIIHGVTVYELPVKSAAENTDAMLRAGFAMGRRPADNERVLRRFLMKAGVDVLYADEATTHRYAAVFRQLRMQGTPIPTHDLRIAALVLQHDLLLHSGDRHFDHLPQIVRV